MYTTEFKFFANKKFCYCYSYNSVEVLESPGMSLTVLEKSWNFEKVLVKVKNISWKVLESPGISISFLLET